MQEFAQDREAPAAEDPSAAIEEAAPAQQTSSDHSASGDGPHTCLTAVLTADTEGSCHDRRVKRICLARLNCSAARSAICSEFTAVCGESMLPACDATALVTW